ncbi:hypothetical protein Pla144_22780 [Bythopirellula polymerisocia]|uniref:Uncharacterized protein n=1 Tax=Bythopirellula polymerisocia TaxID=2528003 RepID=A0A5C6CV14_9BACT|nr:hypothetical protein Pla144_22780 [Bythopirellula polymerisocia]
MVGFAQLATARRVLYPEDPQKNRENQGPTDAPFRSPFRGIVCKNATVFDLKSVEPRGFEPLTSGLRMSLENKHIDRISP